MKNTITLAICLTAGIGLGFAIGQPVGANELYKDMFVGNVSCTRLPTEITDNPVIISKGSALPDAPRKIGEVR
ncbi:MAG: hypothetical protein ACUZ8H_10330 [Candidatus Anammoxibacter sp.]